MKSTRTCITCFVVCSMLLLAFSNIFSRHPWDLDPPNVTTTTGELLAKAFDQKSCLSRYQSSLYRKPSPYKPSLDLISKLRSYEKLHKRCAPGTESYKRATENLHKLSDGSGEQCQYIVWVPLSGLGNRILSLVSVFLYALLTGRVILVDQRNDINDLFCEPFPDASWLLPLGFPLTNQIDRFNWRSPRSFGNMLKHHRLISNSSIKSFQTSYLYLHLVHNYGEYDQMFFCQGDQSLIREVPWLIVKSDNYFVPSLWLLPRFQSELTKLFPKKDTVFHHLEQTRGSGFRYGFSIAQGFSSSYSTRLYHVHKERNCYPKHKKKKKKNHRKSIFSQTLFLAGRAFYKKSDISKKTTPKLRAVLVTSLNPEYSNNLKRVYWERVSSTGDVIIGVYQASQEMHQQRNKKLHNQKALAEIYLLSLTDNIVTSAWSTFGYVAQGLGGMKPWILYKPENYTVPDPSCGRATSMEPCFHSPPLYGCEANTGGTDALKIASPFVRRCEDRVSGIKLFDHPQEL
ncbi:hypothetical protein F2Q68_00013353 [Brassica cretica]|uniref:Fucosyltransferase n=1 Tax=Brassica cretica TaxID=69181 RepID=A0A8S9HJ63_BRACR|nr:hypothetical protein F2Q68_00013353 [Brassica cretica]